jgi:pyruvate,water dikinase
MNYIQPLNELDRTDLPTAGGKGANLGALLRAGLPVPPGFCVTTAAYRRFVSQNGMEAALQQRLERLQADDPLALDEAAEAIQRLFAAGRVPDEIAAQIREGYQTLFDEEAAPVAVRSSATAEDLPDLSFAGQQDTYLNIVGEAALLDAVVRCWASLWTARAIGYRARNHIDQAQVALAVVVQRMVPSEASGVLFTANPLTGKRAEIVIDATLGLGEALVSGMVEPDHYVIDTSGQAHRILQKTLGSKARAVHGVNGGGTRVIAQSSAAVQALPDAQILELARLGRAAEQFFGAPQDMEWAWAGGSLYVVQSRAITSLYPLPRRAPAAPLEVLFSFAYWQGMLRPLSPVGQDSFTGLVAGMARVFGSQTTLREQDLLLEAGERLYVNITGLVRSPTGRAIARVFIDAIDPVSAVILEELLEDPRLALVEGEMSLGARLRLARGFAPLVVNILYNILWPVQGRKRMMNRIDRYIQSLRSQMSTAGSFAELARRIENMPNNAPTILLPTLLPGIISGMAPLQIIIRMAAAIENGPELAYELTRGLPHNVTTEMDLELWAVSRAIQADPLAARHFETSSAEALSTEYLAGQLPPAAQKALQDFMQTYGMRGVAEIDIFSPRWKEEPVHIFQVLKSYLELDESAASPEAVFRSGAEKARQAREALIAGLRKTRGGAIKARLVRFLARRVNELGGLREMPKFTIVRILDVARAPLLSAARQLVASGTLDRPEDIFFLHLWELEELAAGNLPGARRLVEERRQAYDRELQRRRVPRILLSDGTSFYDAPSSAGADGEKVFCGSPVSAGMVEGAVRVVLDPHGSRLLPGEILVCPATDPAWTPLFLAAGGLVMEVGGMMTHGSVVAREYGIPAVVGVSEVTTRLKTGQRVRVDGSRGLVQVLDEAA